MKLILILLTALALIGCGTVKKQKESTEIKTEIDSTSKTSKETQKEGSKETKINYKLNEYIFEPLDATIPFFVDGKEYKNVIVKSKEETKDTFTLEQYKEKIFELTETITKLQQELEQVKKDKETDNTAVYSEFKWLIIILFVITLAYYHFTKPKQL